MTAANYELTDEQARGALFYAVRTLQDVMGMLRRAFEAVDEKDANAIHAAHIRAQRQRIEKMGIRDQDRTILRAHPLFPLWKLMAAAAALIERMLIITNPDLNPGRKRSIDPDKAEAAASKMALKIEAA
jgi:hypothetical protein